MLACFLKILLTLLKKCYLNLLTLITSKLLISVLRASLVPSYTLYLLLIICLYILTTKLCQNFLLMDVISASMDVIPAKIEKNVKIH